MWAIAGVAILFLLASGDRMVGLMALAVVISVALGVLSGVAGV